MVYDVMIIQYDNHNEELALIINKIEPKKLVIIFRTKHENIELYSQLFNKYKIEKYYVSNDFNLLDQIIKKYSKFNTILLLNGGKRLYSLQMLDIGQKYGLNSIYIDILTKRRYIFGDNKRMINRQLDDLYIDYIAKLSGVEIVNVSNDLCKDKEIIQLTKKIMNNIVIWKQYKNYLYNNKIFIHDYGNENQIKIIRKSLKENEINILDKIIKYLLEKEIIKCEINSSEYIIDFLNMYLKRFIFKSGTWLEILTYLTIQEINSVDEVKCGVEFLWNVEKNKIRNELDVVAVKDSILICISCKDSNKYDEDSLNELEVYSKVMGGNNVVKVLVATKRPLKQAIIQRAKEMNINIVILENTIIKFKQDLERIINNI